MSTLAPDSQPMRALAEGNRIRLHRAQIKRAINAGEMTVGEALTEPDCENMTIFELFRSQNRWGKTRTRRLMNYFGFSEMKLVGSLTVRQCKEIDRALSTDLVPALYRAESADGRRGRLNAEEIHRRFNSFTKKRRDRIIKVQRQEHLSLLQVGYRYPDLFEVPGE